MKKNIIIYCLLIVAMALFSYSCKKRAVPVEKHMYEKLQGIRKADKADKPIERMDVLALQLVDYYEHGGSKLKLTEAYYYAGRVFYERRDFSQSLYYFQKAIDALPDSDDPALEGVIYSQLGYLFSQHRLSEEAVDAFKNSYNYYKGANDTLGMIYGLRDLGNEWKNQGKYDDSEAVLQDAFALLRQKPIDYLYSGNRSQMAILRLHQKRYLEAKQEIGEALKSVSGPDRSGVYTVASKIYMALGMTDSVEFYSKQLLTLGTIYARCSANERLAVIALQRKQPQQALQYLKEYERLNDSINETTSTENVARINAMYNYQQRERENAALRESNQRKSLYLAIALVAVVVLSALCIAGFLFYRNRKETLWLKSEILEQTKLWQQTKEEKEEVERKREQLLAFPICQRISHLQETDSEVGLSEDEWRELEQAVNAVYPRFTERLEGLCKITTQELQVCLLRKMDVPPVKTAKLIHKSKQAVNSIRERLYQKAFGQKGTPQQWDEFLMSV